MTTNLQEEFEGLPQPGETIARAYKVVRLLGVGGMGAVLEADNEEIGGRCALKIMLPSLLDDEEFKARFAREARLSQQVESEHVVRVFDVGALEDGRLFMAMELLDGHDLAAELDARGALPVAEAVGIVLEAIDALHEAHKRGIVHRDLKPANLFLANRPEGGRTVKVVDFGISKKLGNMHQGDGPSLTATDSMLGSPKYMSPEQIKNAKGVDGRTDIWSLGVILYKMLLDRFPYGGESLGEYITVLAFEPPAPIEPNERSIPDALATAILRCLDKKPEGRYRTVARLAADLEPFAPVHARPILDRLRREEPNAFPELPTGANRTTAMPGRPLPPQVLAPSTATSARPSRSTEATVVERRAPESTVSEATVTEATVTDANASELRSALAGIRVSAKPVERRSPVLILVVAAVLLAAGAAAVYALVLR